MERKVTAKWPAPNKAIGIFFVWNLSKVERMECRRLEILLRKDRARFISRSQMGMEYIDNEESRIQLVLVNIGS